jgi:hypothetical protein
MYRCVSNVPVQMTFAAMLIYAFHAALENREVALKRIGVNLATAIFARTMIDIFMASKVFVQVRVLASFIGSCQMLPSRYWREESEPNARQKCLQHESCEPCRRARQATGSRAYARSRDASACPLSGR